MSQKTIMQFINYQPRVYSGFDKYLISLSSKLRSEGFQVVFVFYKDLMSAPILKKDILKEGIKIEFLNDELGKLNLLKQIIGLFLKYRPSLVHTHFDDLSKVLISTCALFFRVPVITSIHSELTPYSKDNYLKKKGILKYIIFRAYLTFLMWSGKYCFCVSKQIRDQFISYTRYSNKIKVVYLGLESPKIIQNKITVRTKLNLPENHLLICNVSAIEHIKGLDLIIEAIEILKNEYKFEKFTFYHFGGLRNGDETNEYLNQLNKMIVDKGLQNHFKWMGKRNDIIDILPAFDIYIQPSRKEGLPVSLIEACAVGLPCVGTEISGIPEIVLDNINGFVIDSDSSQQLTEKLAKLMENSKLQLKMGKESLHIFSENFQLESQINKSLKLYSAIIPISSFS